MKRLWQLSLVVLLLGNAIDGIATRLLVYQVGIEAEMNFLARQAMEHLGLFFSLILIKIVFVSAVLLAVVHLVRLFLTEIFNSWVGIRFATALAFLTGISLALSGTGWGEKILLAVVPMRIIYLIIDLSRSWRGWMLISTIATFLFFAFLTCTVLPILLLLDRRMRRGQF